MASPIALQLTRVAKSLPLRLHYNPKTHLNSIGAGETRRAAVSARTIMRRMKSKGAAGGED